MSYLCAESVRTNNSRQRSLKYSYKAIFVLKRFSFIVGFSESLLSIDSTNKTLTSHTTPKHLADLAILSIPGCCAASIASEQQHKQDLREIYRRGDEFSN